MACIYLAVGTVTSTALAVAKACQTYLESLSHQVILDNSPSLASFSQAKADALLICTSTTGAGDLPANIRPFYAELDNAALPQGMPFGVISLGDSSYDDTFCNAGALFEERLLTLLGTQTVPRVTIDAIESAFPDEDALFWLKEWAEATF